MEYRNSYNQVSSLADRIREQSLRPKARPRKGLASREMPKPITSTRFSPEQYLAFMRGRYEEEETQTSPLAPKESPRPKAYADVVAGDTELIKDPAFMREIEKLEEKFPGLKRGEIFSIIRGESKFNSSAYNKESKASGLFQFIPVAAKDLGVSVDEIRKMSPAQQVELYGKYLDFWDYNPSNSLAIMQAAPALAKRSNPEDVIYKVGSKEWKANPGWRSGKDGPITLTSINSYYNRGR